MELQKSNGKIRRFFHYLCLFGLLFIFICFFLFLSGQKDDSEGFNGKNVSEEFYLVKSIEDFNSYARLFNEGKVAAKEICFANSLDFSKSEIVSLGNCQNVFYGCIWAKTGVVLSNLTIDCTLQEDDSNLSGLVAYGGDLCFFNLRFQNVTLDSCKDAFCGVLCARADTLVVNNVLIDGLIEMGEDAVLGAVAGMVKGRCFMQNIKVEGNFFKKRSTKLVGKTLDKTFSKNIII